MCPLTSPYVDNVYFPVDRPPLYRYVLSKDGIGEFRFGYRPILHYFLVSHIIAAAIMVLWVILVGGLKKHDET